MRTLQVCSVLKKTYMHACNKCSVKLLVQILNVLLGVADIFKTPANSRSKNIVPINNECPDMPLGEISVMRTPEELG